MAMTLIAAYDISSDPRRAKLAALLQANGDRIQKSVFLIEVDEASLGQLRARALDIIDPDVDSFYIFRQCGSCWAEVECLGQAEPPSRELYWAVF